MSLYNKIRSAITLRARALAPKATPTVCNIPSGIGFFRESGKQANRSEGKSDRRKKRRQKCLTRNQSQHWLFL